MKHLPLPENQTIVRILPGEEKDIVTVFGETYVLSFNFRHPQQAPVEKEVLWEDCIDNDGQSKNCQYFISVVHERTEANRVFVCRTVNMETHMETSCCDMIMSEEPPKCKPADDLKDIRGSVRKFVIKKNAHSALDESADSAALYVTSSGSGSQDSVGIQKFGRHRVGPANHVKVQQYVGLMLSRRGDEPLQNRVYAFYKEKDVDKGLYSRMWLPLVSQVCMADIGGPKNNLQFIWTSQMSARLFCGDPESKQSFSELVDVATVHADQWKETRVYALFRNEWGMSAVCVYKIGDIDDVFRTSPFSVSAADRSRVCVPDSTKIPLDTLRKIQMSTQMEEWIRPEGKSGPLLVSPYNYTHIRVDGVLPNGNDHPVLFLSLNHGGVHKVMQNNSQAFVIADYRPFTHGGQIHDIILPRSSRKLYVGSRSELVQLDVASCGQYGDTCQECVLARDPYCGWNKTHCTSATQGTLQDVSMGNPDVCLSTSKVHRSERVFSNDEIDFAAAITLPPQSKYFLQCPVSSHHAQYTWRHLEYTASCNPTHLQCLLLLHDVGPEQEGTYTCVSEEKGYVQVRAQYDLQVEDKSPGRTSSPLVWACLTAALVMSASC